MSERPTARPPIDNVRWASVDQTEVVDPSSGLKDDGYPDSAIPANEEHNSQWYRQYLRELYQEGVVPRVFEALAQALDVGVPVGEIFRVLGFNPGTDNLLSPGDLLQTIISGGLVDVATDGQRIFRTAGFTLEAFPAFSGAASAWGPVTPEPLVSTQALEADGLNVYVATFSKVFLINPATGATLQTIDPTVAVGDIAANGVDLLIVLGASQTVRVYTTLGGGPPTLTGASLTHGGAINAVALDHDQGYQAGAPGTGGNLIHAFSLATPGAAFLWGTILPMTAVQDCKADGEFVYVVGIAADPGDNIFCLRRTDGGIVWSARTFGSNAGRCAVDDRYLWTSAGTSPVALDKSSGQAVWAPGIFTAWDPVAADGCCVVGMDSGNDIVVRAKADLTTRFLSVENDDAKRRPFPRIALPLRERAAGAAKQRFEFIDLFEENVAGNGVEAFSGAFVGFFTGGPLTFGPVEAGDYLIRWSYKWQHTNQSGEFRGRCVVDAANVNVRFHEEEASDIGAGIQQLSSGSGVVSLTAATHTIDLEVASNTPGTARMFEGLVSIFRIR
jgi:hypothetical protein